MSNRTYTDHAERKLKQKDGWSTAAPADYPASAGGNGLGAYTKPGKGAGLNDTAGVKKSVKPLSDTLVGWPSAGPEPAPRFEGNSIPRVKTHVVRKGH